MHRIDPPKCDSTSNHIAKPLALNLPSFEFAYDATMSALIAIN